MRSMPGSKSHKCGRQAKLRTLASVQHWPGRDCNFIVPPHLELVDSGQSRRNGRVLASSMPPHDSTGQRLYYTIYWAAWSGKREVLHYR